MGGQHTRWSGETPLLYDTCQNTDAFLSYICNYNKAYILNANVLNVWFVTMMLNSDRAAPYEGGTYCQMFATEHWSPTGQVAAAIYITTLDLI